MKNWKEINERREGYIQKRNAENMRVETLTESQHEVLQWLCAMRHEIHTNSEDMFYCERCNYSMLWALLDDDNNESLNARLAEESLPPIDFSLVETNLPNDSDYIYALSEEDREEWENKAEEINETHPNGAYVHNGYSLWIEEGEEYRIFVDEIEKINSTIENYLREIDSNYGTNYCPSGSQRLY